MIEYEKDAIVHPYITRYLREELAENSDFLRQMEAYAAEHEVPVVQPETAKFISCLSYMLRPKRILEVGCAIGYSSILMAQGLAEGGTVQTLEMNPEMVQTARRNIKQAGLEQTITVVEADAKEYMSCVEGDGEFDYIFLDGPKAHYIYMLDDCVRLLRKGGILVADNVLYKGMTAENSLVIRRKITIVKRLRKFITALTSRDDLETSVLPLGDGVTLSVKK